jgi:AraC-like DNA-binding protein
MVICFVFMALFFIQRKRMNCPGKSVFCVRSRTFYDKPMYAIMPVIRGIVYGAARRGASADAICQGAGLSLAELDEGQKRVPHPIGIAVWEQALLLTGDETLGLHIGQQASPGVVGMIGHLMQSSPTLGEAFRQLEQYNLLVTDMLFYTAAVEGPYFVCRYTPAAEWLALSPHTAQQAVAQAMAGTLQVFGLLSSQPVRPLKVSLQADPRHHQSYEQFFGVPVAVGQAHNALFFPARLAQEPVVTFNSELMQLLQFNSEQALAQQHSSFGDRLRQQLLRLAGHHWPTLEELASSQQLHPRQLQRQLEAEGSSYRQLLDEVRQALSQAFLQGRSLNQQQLAELLGYSDASSYRRALRRWRQG